jgi:hypothetical protein
MKIKTADLDCFYISFDEPNKEKHWAMLQQIVPWSNRVDGVVGFDAAHKACAKQSETDYLITVDGDNTVDPSFFELELDVPSQHDNCVLSWNSINVINGLCYGNGGLKIWPKQFLLDMKSHEAAESESHAVDFCWDEKYLQLVNVYSTTHPNGSKEQAFRAGFREGVKMTLDRGTVIPPDQLKQKLYPPNLRRLLLWGSLGSDVINGSWAVFGTRVGTHYANVLQNDIKLVSDYVQLNELVKQYTSMTDTDVVSTMHTITNEIDEATGIRFVDYTAEQSAYVKENVMWHSNGRSALTTEREVLWRV